MSLTDNIEKARKKVIAADLDGTLTNIRYIPGFWEMTMKELGDYYLTLSPNNDIKRKINNLYDNGFTINIFTSRWDLYKPQTKKWLEQNEVKYHELQMNKPFYDFIIDDKAIELNNIERIK